MFDSQRRRSSRFPAPAIALTSPDLPGEVREVSRTGLRLHSIVACEIGQILDLSLSAAGETVHATGRVRWCRSEVDSATGDTEAGWDIGIAFVTVGPVSPGGIWRGLEPYRAVVPKKN